jgi:hypothetical protein
MTEMLHADSHVGAFHFGPKLTTCSRQQVGSGKGSTEGWRGCRQLGSAGSDGDKPTHRNERDERDTHPWLTSRQLLIPHWIVSVKVVVCWVEPAPPETVTV